MQSQFRTTVGSSNLQDSVQETIANQSEITYVPAIFFSPGQMKEIIKNLPNRRLPEIDNKNNHALKRSGRKSNHYLCQIYNW